MTTNTDIIEVDAKYKSCPGPIIDLSQAVKNAKPGQIILLLATDPASPSDAKEWATQVGHKFLEYTEKEGVYQIKIQVQ